MLYPGTLVCADTQTRSCSCPSCHLQSINFAPVAWGKIPKIEMKNTTILARVANIVRFASCLVFTFPSRSRYPSRTQKKERKERGVIRLSDALNFGFMFEFAWGTIAAHTFVGLASGFDRLLKSALLQNNVPDACNRAQTSSSGQGPIVTDFYFLFWFRVFVSSFSSVA